MIKKLLLLILISLPSISFSQVFYTETFDGTVCAATSGCDPSTVAWTTTNTGTNGANPNKFYVSCQENGNAAGQCGTGCGSDQSLHVGNIATSTAAFIFCPAGDCGAAYDDTSPGEATDKRCESPVINCTGQSNITLAFNYMEAGQTTLDDATLWYFDGATWTSINALAKTPTGCGGGQGQWTAFSIALPASANNNANVRIGFRWVNNGDGVATDPSFAVDDITLSATTTTPPVASFTASDQTPCTNDCISFTNTSTGAPFTSTSWTFTGGTPASSTANNPTNICYNTPGTYQVILTVTNANGTDTETQAGFITVTNCTTPPVASFTASDQTPCTNDCINFTNTSTGAPFTSTSWTFTGGTPASSTAANPTNICYNTPGTYQVILTVTNAGGTDTETQAGFITVTNCTTPPIASFTASDQTPCTNDCISFTNTSTGGPFTSTSWTFTGGTPASSTAANPTNICYNTPGTYQVILTVTDANGTDTETQAGFITVTNCSLPPVASFTASSTTVCVGEVVTLTDNSTNNPSSWSWTLAGGTPASSTTQNPTVTYAAPGVYSVSLTATNGSGSNTSTQNNYITVVNCPLPTATFTASDTDICPGDCITFNNTSSNGTSYAWSFPGGVPASSTAQNPGTICFPTTGNYTVTLTVTNGTGSDTETTSINVNSAPTLTVDGDTTVNLGNSVPIEAIGSGSGNYLWTPSTGVNCPTCASTTVYPQESTYYVVQYSEGGCVATDSVYIIVNIIEAIEVPNAFSPNGDSNNDYLFVLGEGIFKMNLKIYNRYGQLVFETSDQAIGWDGKHNGKDANTGVFAYVLEFTMSSGEIGVKKGNITMVR